MCFKKKGIFSFWSNKYFFYANIQFNNLQNGKP